MEMACIFTFLISSFFFFFYNGDTDTDTAPGTEQCVSFIWISSINDNILPISASTYDPQYCFFGMQKGKRERAV